MCVRALVHKQAAHIHITYMHTLPYLALPSLSLPCLALPSLAYQNSLSLSRSLSLRDLLKLLHWDWRRALVHGVKGADLLQGPFVLEEIERFEVARICDLERVGA